MLNKKAKVDLAENSFYVFVCLPSRSAPAYTSFPIVSWADSFVTITSSGLKRRGRGDNPTATRICGASMM